MKSIKRGLKCKSGWFLFMLCFSLTADNVKAESPKQQSGMNKVIDSGAEATSTPWLMDSRKATRSGLREARCEQTALSNAN